MAQKGLNKALVTDKGEVIMVDRDAFIPGVPQAALNANLMLPVAGLAAIDTFDADSALRSMYLQFVPLGTIAGGVVSFEGSNDNVSFVALQLFDSAAPGSLPVTSFAPATATPRFFEGRIKFRYVRARISTAISGAGAGCVCRARLSPLDIPLANHSANIAFINGVAPLMGNGVTGNGSPRVTLASDAAQPTNLQNPNTSSSNLNSANTTNATLVKGSAGSVFTVVATNNGAAVAFLKLYNKVTAPTVGTDVPLLVVSVPANGVPVTIDSALGMRFTAGIGFGITNLIADSDTTAVAANQVKVKIDYV